MPRKKFAVSLRQADASDRRRSWDGHRVWAGRRRKQRVRFLGRSRTRFLRRGLYCWRLQGGDVRLLRELSVSRYLAQTDIRENAGSRHFLIKRNESPKEWATRFLRGMATAAMGSGFAFETKSQSLCGAACANRGVVRAYAPTMTWTTKSAPPKTNRKPTIGRTNFNQCVYFMSSIVNVAMTRPVGAR